jgi:murein DD-endopeptidase MepM/ murein hydrolase activator NlpD
MTRLTTRPIVLVSRSARIAILVLLVFASCTIPRWPVNGTLTSPYGLRFRGASPDLHPGVDIAAPTGTPVLAMKPGTVIFAGTMSGYGLTVRVDHGRGLRTLYGHLSRIDVSTGQEVEHQQVLGAVGATGNATAPHLHFEITRGGRQEDPVPLLGDHPHR